MDKTAYHKFQLALQYFLYYGIVGIHLPYLNLYFHEAGFSGRQIGTLASLRTLCIIIFPFLWGMLADRFGLRKTVYILCNTASALIWGIYLFTAGFLPIAAVTFAFAVFYSPIIAFLEAFSMDILGMAKKSYGQIRLWGSVSFVSVVLILGQLISGSDVKIIIPLSLGLMLVMAALSLFFPKPLQHSHHFSMKSVSFLLKSDVVLFLSASVMMLASHGAYYGFLSIKLATEGASASYIGVVWAVGSVSEIFVMLYSKELFRKIKIETVLVYSFAFSAARWLIVCFLGDQPVFMLFSQLLHAVTYGCFHMACVLFTDSISGEGSKTIAQSVNNSMSYGLGLMTGIFTCGLFYDRYRNMIFLGCTAVALCGGFLMKLAMNVHSEKTDFQES